jgi:hypothetical protein
VRKIGAHLGRVSLWLWSGEWVVFSRNGLSEKRFDLRQCGCHRLCVFAGPVGVEVRHR